MSAYDALLNLSALNPLEWEQIAAHIIKNLNGVPVERVYFVSKLNQSHHGVRINFR